MALADRDMTVDDVIRVFDRLMHDAAFLPYWPEMLKYDLPENKQAELDEIEAYHASFPCP